MGQGMRYTREASAVLAATARERPTAQRHPLLYPLLYPLPDTMSDTMSDTMPA